MADKQIVKSMGYRQSEVDYITVSPETGVRQCANCRFFCPSHMEYNESSYLAGASCAIVEPYPLAILPTGMCNKHELMPMDTEPDPLEVVIVDVEVESDEEMAYATPKQIKAAAWRRFIGQPNPPSMTIWKEADGLRRMLIVTSNGYEDRENEHVATRALAQYVKESYNAAGEYIGANKLLFYHESPLDIGDIISADMISGFLVELAKERGDSPIAAQIWDYIESTAIDKSVQWGASHGFRAVKRDNVYVRIRKKETTVLDVNDAANWFTFAGVI